MGGELGVGRAPFREMGEREAGAEQQRDVGRGRAVLLLDALGEPVRRPRAFDEIGIDRPRLAAVATFEAAASTSTVAGGVVIEFAEGDAPTLISTRQGRPAT